jgi:hypothetical protein
LKTLTIDESNVRVDELIHDRRPDLKIVFLEARTTNEPDSREEKNFYFTVQMH